MRCLHRGLLSVVLCFAISSISAANAVETFYIAPQGQTHFCAVVEGDRVSVKVLTHAVHIKRLKNGQVPDKSSACTYSKFPCSMVDYVEIHVGDGELIVPRSVFADLADLSAASIGRRKDGEFVLVLKGGDASEAYEVDVVFDKKMIKRRMLLSSEMGGVMEETIYH